LANLTLVNGTDGGIAGILYNDGFNTTGSGVPSGWTQDSAVYGSFDVTNTGTKTPDANVRMRITAAYGSTSMHYPITNGEKISSISFIFNLTGPFASQYFSVSNGSGTNLLQITTSNSGTPNTISCGNETSTTAVSTLSYNIRTLFRLDINNTGDNSVRLYKNGVYQGTCYSSSNIGTADRLVLAASTDAGAASATLYFDELNIATTSVYNPLLNFSSNTVSPGTFILSGNSFVVHPVIYQTGLLGGSPNITINIYNSVGSLIQSSSSQQSVNYSVSVSGLSVGTYYLNATMSNGTHYGISYTRNLSISSLNNSGINTPYDGQQISVSSVNISWNVSTTNATYSNLTHYNITLLNRDLSFNQSISSNVSTNTSYVWNIGSAGLGTGTYYVRVYSYDSLGNYVSEENKIHYFTPTYSLSNPILETQSNIMIINFSTTKLDFNVSSFYGNLTINGVTYTLTSSNVSGSWLAGVVNATMPNVTTNTIFNYTWNVTIDGLNHQFNSTLTVSVLTPITFTNGSCSAGLSTGIFFDSKSEETRLPLMTNLSYNFLIGVANNQYELSYGNITNSYSFSVCINSTQAPTWTVGYGEVQYESSGYADRRYYIFNNTRITSTTTNITLYSLLSTLQTSFQITVQSKISAAPYRNKYLALIRWYPEINSYLIVDMGLTDNTGSTVIHSVVEDVDYRFAVYELDGTLIALKDPIRMVCLTTPCAYTITIDNSDTDFDNLINLQTSLEYNITTGVWTLTYNDPSQSTTNVNLTIYKEQGDSSYVICNSNLNTYTGVVTCTTTLYANAKLRAVVARSASPEVPILTKVVILSDSALTSSFGLFLSLILVIPITFLMALLSPIFAVVGVVIATLIAYSFGSINYLIITGFAILGGITLHFMGKVNR
jgi:hypothetical protein